MGHCWIGLYVYGSMVMTIYAMSYSSVTKENKHVSNPARHTAAFRSVILRETLVQANSENNGQQYDIIPSCLCSKIYDPVCSTNNKSFYNPCRLDCYAKYWNTQMTIKHQGNCITYK